MAIDLTDDRLAFYIVCRLAEQAGVCCDPIPHEGSRLELSEATFDCFDGLIIAGRGKRYRLTVQADELTT